MDAVGADKADAVQHQWWCGRRIGLRFLAISAKVGTLIAHEPPLASCLPDAAHMRTAVDDMEDLTREIRPGAGFSKFISSPYLGPVTEAGATSCRLAAPRPGR